MLSGSTRVKALCRTLMKLTPMVNFINNLRADILYEHHFGSFFSTNVRTYVRTHVRKKKAAETTFVRNICTFNVDEIDT